jgi:hypothetical protein
MIWVPQAQRLLWCCKVTGQHDKCSVKVIRMSRKDIQKGDEWAVVKSHGVQTRTSSFKWIVNMEINKDDQPILKKQKCTRHWIWKPTYPSVIWWHVETASWNMNDVRVRTTLRDGNLWTSQRSMGGNESYDDQCKKKPVIRCRVLRLLSKRKCGILLPTVINVEAKGNSLSL